MTSRDALLAAVRGLSPDQPITVPAGWVQTVLATPDAVTVDLSGSRVAELLNRDPRTIATWCRSGLLPGSYRMRGRREWRIPVAVLERFQHEQAGNPA